MAFIIEHEWERKHVHNYDKYWGTHLKNSEINEIQEALDDIRKAPTCYKEDAKYHDTMRMLERVLIRKVEADRKCRVVNVEYKFSKGEFGTTLLTCEKR